MTASLVAHITVGTTINSAVEGCGCIRTYAVDVSQLFEKMVDHTYINTCLVVDC